MDFIGPNVNYENIFLKDANKVGIFELNTIESITYSSYKREVNINLNNGDTFSFKRKFADMERLLKVNSDFVKIERGTIVNILLIQAINYKQEYIYFKSGNKLNLNKNKLKQIEEMIFYKASAFYL